MSIIEKWEWAGDEATKPETSEMLLFCIEVQRFDKNNFNSLSIIAVYRCIPEHYRAIIWEFENSILGQNFSITYKSLALDLWPRCVNSV